MQISIISNLTKPEFANYLFKYKKIIIFDSLFRFEFMNTYQIVSEDEKETKKIANAISQSFQKGDLILLNGELGTGKTHFVKGFADGYNYNGDVTSPTFNIANFYENDLITLLHIDLYRIETIEEFNDLGLFEYFSDSIVLIEWGDKFAEYFNEYFSVNIEHFENDKRRISFRVNGNNHSSKIKEIEKKINEL